MNIPRLIGLNISQGIDKMKLSYKEGTIKRLQGREAKIETNDEKTFKANSAKKAKLDDEISNLQKKCKTLKNRCEDRSQKIKTEKEKLFGNVAMKTISKKEIKGEKVDKKGEKEDKYENEVQSQIEELRKGSYEYKIIELNLNTLYEKEEKKALTPIQSAALDDLENKMKALEKEFRETAVLQVNLKHSGIA